MITLKRVNDAVAFARGYTDYYPSTNKTLGPHDVNNLRGPSTERYYDCSREWDTEIAIAAAEEEFSVDLSRHEIVKSGPWRDTVRSIHAAVNAELSAESEFENEVGNGNS